MSSRFFAHMICGQAGVRMRSDIFRSQGLRQLNQRSNARSQQFSVTAICADPRKLTSCDVHIVAPAGSKREAIGDKWMANDRITALKFSNSFSHLFYPTGV